MVKFGKVKVDLDDIAIGLLLASKNGPVAKELLRVGSKIEAEAKKLLSNELVNVQTGRLRASTSHALFKKGRSLGVRVGSDTDYAIHVHQGARGKAGRPYLVLAAKKVLGRFP